MMSICQSIGSKKVPRVKGQRAWESPVIFKVVYSKCKQALHHKGCNAKIPPGLVCPPDHSFQARSFFHRKPPSGAPWTTKSASDSQPISSPFLHHGHCWRTAPWVHLGKDIISAFHSWHRSPIRRVHQRPLRSVPFPDSRLPRGQGCVYDVPRLWTRYRQEVLPSAPSTTRVPIRLFRQPWPLAWAIPVSPVGPVRDTIFVCLVLRSLGN